MRTRMDVYEGDYHNREQGCGRMQVHGSACEGVRVCASACKRVRVCEGMHAFGHGDIRADGTHA